jgi:hypothetical protein
MNKLEIKQFTTTKKEDMFRNECGFVIGSKTKQTPKVWSLHMGLDPKYKKIWHHLLTKSQQLKFKKLVLLFEKQVFKLGLLHLECGNKIQIRGVLDLKFLGPGFL